MRPFSHHLLLLAFVSAIYLCSCSSLTKPSDLITSICSKTRNATYCLEFLVRYDRPGITLQELAIDAIQDTILVVLLSKDVIHVGGLELTDPEVIALYQRCEVQYTAAIDALKEWGDRIKSDDYKKLPSIASLALRQPSDCDANFAPTKNEPGFIKDVNNETSNICSIILVVSNNLAAGKI